MICLEIIKEFREQIFKGRALIQDDCTLKVTISLLRSFFNLLQIKGSREQQRRKLQQMDYELLQGRALNSNLIQLK